MRDGLTDDPLHERAQHDGGTVVGLTQHAQTEATGKSQSQLIREAVDRFIEQFQEGSRADILNAAAGLWEHREDLPDFAYAAGSRPLPTGREVGHARPLLLDTDILIDYLRRRAEAVSFLRQAGPSLRVCWCLLVPKLRLGNPVREAPASRPHHYQTRITSIKPSCPA